MFSDPYYLISTLTLAVLPSLVWLFFYLKEDLHPEPKYWLTITFLIGIALAPLVVFLEMFLNKWNSSVLIFIIAPIVEEVAKYGAVHLSLNKNPVLNEPVDGMIYVIVSALGFAAIENVFAIFSFIPVGSFEYLSATFNFMSMRFISAVALHGLASGIVGYYFSKFYFFERKPILIFKGLFLAIALHSAYNFLIIRNDEGTLPLFLIGIILGSAAVLVLYFFNQLKHYKIYQQAAVDEIIENKI